MKSCGIYGIFNSITGKVLVGSSIHISARWTHHRCMARINKHANRHFQSAWNKDGEGAFEFRILEECAQNDLIPREDYWMSFHKSLDPQFGYNFKNASLTIISEETKAKIGQAGTGRIHAEETKNKMRLAAIGVSKSKESVEKSAAAHRGKKASEETKRKMSLAIKRRWDLGLMDNRKKPKENSGWFKKGSVAGSEFRFKPKNAGVRIGAAFGA